MVLFGVVVVVVVDSGVFSPVSGVAAEIRFRTPHNTQGSNKIPTTAAAAATTAPRHSATLSAR